MKEFHLVGRFVQVLWLLLWQRAAEKRDLQKYPRPLALFIDEGQYFMNKYFPMYQCTARSARCASVVMTQNLHSLESQIGKPETEALLGNFNNKFFCCNDDSATNLWSAKMLGESWVLGGSANVNLGGDGSASGGVSESRRYLIEPMEFIKLKKGGQENNFQVESLCFKSGQPFRGSGANHLRVLFPQKLGV